jgi:hypothetical protein
MSYQIYTTSSFQLLISHKQYRTQLTISKNYNNTIVYQHYLTQLTPPWISINSTSNDLTLYDITFLNNDQDEEVIEIHY